MNHKKPRITLGSIIVFALAVGGMGMFLDHFSYSLEDTLRVLHAPAGLETLEEGEFVKVTGALDYDHAMMLDGADPHLVAPLAGSDATVWVAIPGGVIPINDPGAVTVEGRVVAKSGSFWEVGDTREVDLTYHGKRLYGLKVSETALVIRDGVRPGDGMAGMWIVGVISALVLFTYAYRIFGALFSLFRREEPALA